MNKRRTAQSKPGLNPFLAGVLVIFAIIGAVLTLEATGKTDLGLAKLWKGKEVQASNVTAVLMPVVAMKPGEVLDAKHVWNPKTRDFQRGLMSTGDVKSLGFVQKLPNIRGRVLARHKPAGEPFTMADFLPKGAQPGLIGQVPEGMQLVFIGEDRVTGLSQLKFQDRFDLSMTIPCDESLAKAAKESLEARGGVTPQETLRLANTQSPQERRLLAQYGMVIEQGVAEGKNKLIAVALFPDDVQLTQDAVNGKLAIDCTARRTIEEGAPERVIQEPFDPSTPFEWVTEGVREVKVIQGKEHETETTRVAESPE
jgi:hypothetical protein